MYLNIAFCDDDSNFLSGIDAILNPYIFNSVHEISYDKYSDSTSLLNAIANNKKYNIFILDMEIAESNGIDVAKQITSQCETEPYIIFISNYPEYMQDSFSVHPFQYLKKPVTAEKIYCILDEIIEKEKRHHVSYIMLDTKESEKTVNVHDIFFIESSGKKSSTIIFHLAKEQIATKGTLSHWEDKLLSFAFCRCFKGILVNIEHIHYISDMKIIMSNGEEVPISRKYFKNIKHEMINNVTTFLH
ncbi:MAG: LytTR family DNA-binding domain-containing protein [Lachnospiraceae bacterium]|nr:LytTR family DNA-binding domain-containing protein [Lachnospiraceae bacterium]